MKNVILLLVVLFLVSCTESGKGANNADHIALNAITQDTIWNTDRSEFDIGKLINGKKVGLWQHYYKGDISRREERYFIENGKMIRCRFFKNDIAYLEENYLQDGVYSISYYSNGCIDTHGYHRIVQGQEGEQDGMWVKYDSLGSLISETVYDYASHKIIYKKFNNEILSEEREYYQESGEATCYKNGIWKFYTNGQLTRTEKHKMESTLENIGD
jgi:hypothetical protein